MSAEKRKLREIIEGEGEGSGCDLNMADGRDRIQLRITLAEGWGVTDEKLRHYGKCLDALLNYALGMREGDDGVMKKAGEVNIRAGISCIKTMKLITDQLLMQEIVNLKNDRIDSGRLTERIGVHDEAEIARIEDLARRTDETFDLKLTGTE